MKIRSEKIEKKHIYIVDDILTKNKIREFYDYANSLSFSRNERDDNDDQYPIFSVDFKPELFENETEIGKISKKLLNRFYPNDSFELYRCYINLSTYGDVEFPHLDCDVKRNDITILYYVNYEWDYTWGGETLFYTNGETKLAIIPKPGRFIIFNGNIEHKGSIPTRICKIPRLSLAFKYFLKS